jgi:hypothetical protein
MQKRRVFAARVISTARKKVHKRAELLIDSTHLLSHTHTGTHTRTTHAPHTRTAHTYTRTRAHTHTRARAHTHAHLHTLSHFCECVCSPSFRGTFLSI